MKCYSRLVGACMLAVCCFMALFFSTNLVSAHDTTAKEVLGREFGDERSFDQLITASELTPDEMATIAATFGAEAYFVTEVPVTVLSGTKLFIIGHVTMDSGDEYGFGDTVLPGETINKGLIWNRSDEPAESAFSGFPNDPISIASGDMMVVGPFLVVSDGSGIPPSGGPQTCSVTCGSGYFACCSFQVGLYPTCQCLQNSTQNPNCTAGGGPGASQCSASQSPPIAPVPKPKRGYEAQQPETAD